MHDSVWPKALTFYAQHTSDAEGSLALLENLRKHRFVEDDTARNSAPAVHLSRRHCLSDDERAPVDAGAQREGLSDSC